jgi:hypothetical protein
MRYFWLGLALVTAFGGGYVLGTYHAAASDAAAAAIAAATDRGGAADQMGHDAAALRAEIEKMRREVCDSQELLDFQLLKMREGLTPGAIETDVDVLKAEQRARREMEDAHGADWVQKHFRARTGCYRGGNGNAAPR